MVHLQLPRRLLAVALATALCAPSAFANADAGDDAEREARLLDAGIAVSAKGTAADWPSALATDVITWQDAVGAPSDFQDLIVRVPGIGATGQNGIFETFSIRGSGANGILVVVGGMPVAAQRRAGVPVSFVEPSLLGEINITRGPATVHFGPGALGGAVSIEPRWFEGGIISGSYATSGNESSVMAGYGNDSFSIGAVRHAAGDAKAANGRPLNSSFERESASLQYRTQFGDYTFDALLLPSRTEDIGKSNSRFPARDSTYPKDDHVVGRLRLRHENGFEASLRGHDQALLTYNQRPGAADTFAYIESRDFGLTVQQTFGSGAFSHNVGIDFLGRRDVNGYDAQRTLANRNYSLRNASEDAWSLFALSDWQVGPQFAVEVGARATRVEQEQAGADSSESDAAFTAGAIWTPVEHSKVTLSLSSGYRFATLEERFFTGVTPQGEIVGNPNLGAEKSLGIDLGYAWHVGNWGAQVHVWRTNVDDLIQLFGIAQGINGYTNVGEAKLHGVEGVVGWTPSTSLTLRSGITLVRSKDELTGDPLYGSPPLTATLEAKYDINDELSLGAFYSHRWRMKRPGFEELPRDAVDVVDLDLTWRINTAWNVQLFVRNAFDENYVATADELSALAPERSVGVNVIWTSN